MAKEIGGDVLNANHRRFVEEYLIDLNGAQAAIRAGYSPATACTTGSQLLSLPQVQAEVTKAFNRRLERTRIKADRVLIELARLAFSDLRHVASWEGDHFTLKDSAELGDDVAPSVKEIKATISKREKGETVTTISLKLHDKVKPIELLMRHMGMFENESEENKLRQMLKKLSNEELAEKARELLPALKKAE